MEKSKKQLFIFNILLIIIIAILNKVALNFFLYWKWWWFDIMMHFLGGLWVGGATLWVYYFSGYFRANQNKKILLWLSIISVVVIGVGWEVFEFVTAIEIFSDGYVGDTILDLIMDTTGAVVAYFMLIKCIEVRDKDQKIDENYKK